MGVVAQALKVAAVARRSGNGFIFHPSLLIRISMGLSQRRVSMCKPERSASPGNWVTSLESSCTPPRKSVLPLRSASSAAIAF
jgi:hypothetical protein